MTVAEAVDTHLSDTKHMQLATAKDNEPRVVTVLFVHDEHMNIYWLSEVGRAHSQDIAANPRAAVAMAIKTDLPVIGLQANGAVEVVTNLMTIQKILRRYVAKHGLGKDYYARAVKGIAKHRLYKLTPDAYRLFDEVHFKAESPVTWRPQGG